MPRGAPATFVAISLVDLTNSGCRENFSDESDTLGLTRIYGLAEKKQLHGFAQADEARQDKTAAGVRRQTDADKGLNELRLFRSDPQVTGESQITTCPGGNAVNGGDNDLFHLPDLPDHRVVFLAQRSAEGSFLLRRPAFEILPGAEGSSRAGDDEATDFFIALTFFQYFQHFLVHLGNKGVERLRAIKRNGGDAVFFLIEDGFVCHGETLLPYLPLNSGLRFSRKAFIPSLRSSEANNR